ncbi:[Pyruvate dehydrogenase (acetyl-transferring)] kinase [Drechslerella dactyloides]|uniref:Protein-serine/threonine kinase n=1 Tax=Drechslerella dactyloides TaxID=74499 RepID=A0AAD6NHC3_DREDA|nr:[Pyruvate dehydrogenase (acetyl-transferring)] kinase [Drechslerella dactyloides]
MLLRSSCSLGPTAVLTIATAVVDGGQLVSMYRYATSSLPRLTRRCNTLAPAPQHESPAIARAVLETPLRTRRHIHPWQPSSALEEHVAREARPISLRQLTFYGRNLTRERLLDSANYVRTELPTRLAHRIRDMQRLPYVVVTNPNISKVYETYYNSFELLRKTPEIKTPEDNDGFCQLIRKMLTENLSVIPNLAIGALECRDFVPAAELDNFLKTMLKSRISRRTIAEQHVALTDTYNSPFFFFPHSSSSSSSSSASSNSNNNNSNNGVARDHTNGVDFVGEVFLKCNAREVVEKCGKLCQYLSRQANGPNSPVPEIIIDGHAEATFPYIPSHLEYIIGELLRNSIQATIERHGGDGNSALPPINVLICQTQQYVIFRISDQGGGIPQDIFPHIWSFSKGPRRQKQLQNISLVPTMSATLQELFHSGMKDGIDEDGKPLRGTSLAPLSHRPPNLRLGLGLPLSRVYAEYWAGSLKLHSLASYGVDTILQINKLGNNLERLVERRNLDSI